VLVVCVGAATRLADFVQAMGKSYASRFRLGATSTTDDADGAITANPNATPPTREQIDAALASFIGIIEQFPPAFSALKLDGHRAHDLARQGKDVPLAARQIHVEAICVLGFDWPFVDVEIDCGKGAYIRSIARDLGSKLGVGGLVETLRRTRVGPFTAEHGIGIDAAPAEVQANLLPMTAAVAGMPTRQIDADSERRFRTGLAIPMPACEQPEGELVAVFDERGDLMAIAVVQRGALQPKIVLTRTQQPR
jgi:tRNA pseudouridine55 synthase